MDVHGVAVGGHAVACERVLRGSLQDVAGEGVLTAVTRADELLGDWFHLTSTMHATRRDGGVFARAGPAKINRKVGARIFHQQRATCDFGHADGQAIAHEGRSRVADTRRAARK